MDFNTGYQEMLRRTSPNNINIDKIISIVISNSPESELLLTKMLFITKCYKKQKSKEKKCFLIIHFLFHKDYSCIDTNSKVFLVCCSHWSNCCLTNANWFLSNTLGITHVNETSCLHFYTVPECAWPPKPHPATAEAQYPPPTYRRSGR